MKEQNKIIPKKIWMLWTQGLTEAPFIVKKCIDSWIRKNPTWDIVILDAGSLKKYIELDIPDNVFSSLSLAAQSDLVRLALLSKHGGVWTDATTFCMKPLDEWFSEYTESGFFTFYKPHPDRILSTWFMAAEKESPIISKLYSQLCMYWVNNNFKKPVMWQRKLRGILARLLNGNKKTTKYWFSTLVTKVFRIHPYLVIHYMFERVVATDIESKLIWDTTKKLSADGPHEIQRHGFFNLPSRKIMKNINEKNTPLYKLTWKYDHSKYMQGTLLHYLLEEVN
jgi:hypothetical protein